MTELLATPPAHAPQANAPATRRCAGCGYDLRGLQQHRCPECGLAFDPNYIPPADIPWLQRANASTGANPGGPGVIAAYLRTAWLVLARPKKLGEMVWQEVEVDADDTMRFRWITIGIACGSLLAPMLPVVGIASSRGVILLLVLTAPIIAFFWIATEKFDIVPFRPTHYREEVRFRRLHDLSCAGLALAPVVPLFLLLGLLVGWSPQAVVRGALALAGVVLLAWWYGSLVYQIHAGRCRTGDAILHALLLPFAWFMIAVVILIFTFGIVGLVTGLIGP